jgi:hypothetical protein
MDNDMDVYRRDGINTRVALKVLVCLIFLLSFYAGASAASSPFRPEEYTSPLSQVSVQTATRTPTLTPTPALSVSGKTSNSAFTLGSIPGQPIVDANTVALYHFDAPTGNNQVIDATGRYTATLNGNATVTSSGLYAGVLQLDGKGSYVRTGHFDNYDLSQGTLEAYIDFNAACATTAEYFPIISAGGEYGNGQPILELTVQPGLAFGIFDTDHWVFADSGINPCRYLIMGGGGFPFPYDDVRFHHVAGTWGPRGVEIWVDGVLHGVGNTDPNSVYEPYPYKCNPQMQFGVQNRPYNPYAPTACPTPVMYPTMASFPPGEYTGGLPAYSTFLIGCDATGACFNGSIDEVRISNIQRTFTMAVLPTNTPTPSPTPVSILGEYSVDANTLALFHFNPAPSGETWEEVSQQYRTLSGQTIVTPDGHFGSGLYLSGNDSFVNPTNLGSPIFAGTVEAWVNFAPGSTSPYQQIFAVTPDNSNLVMSFGASYGNLITLLVANNSVTIPVRPADLAGCWHHLAGTWGPRGLEIWLDGTLSSTNRGFTGGIPGSVISWRIGCDYHGFCVYGRLDEARVSNVQRTFTTAALASARPARLPFQPGSAAALSNGTLTFLPLIEVAPTPQCLFGE